MLVMMSSLDMADCTDESPMPAPLGPVQQCLITQSELPRTSRLCCRREAYAPHLCTMCRIIGGALQGIGQKQALTKASLSPSWAWSVRTSQG